MRASVKGLSLAGAVVATVFMFSAGSTARAALVEKSVLDSINNTIAVLRHLHRQVAEAQESLEMVRAAKDLTQQQLTAMKSLAQTETTKGNKDRAAFFDNRIKRLERQMSHLNEFNFEKLYNDRITDQKALIAKVSIELDARIIEYTTLFGKKPQVEFDFAAEMVRLHPKRAQAAYFLDLD